MKAIAAVATFFCLAGQAPAQGYPASCWVITDLRGVSFHQGDAYKPAEDGISAPITLRLDGDSSTTGISGMVTRQVDQFMALSFSRGDAITTMEVYQIDPSAGIATYTKSMAVKGYMGGASGAMAFVGQAARCR
ncbi:MAG: hypothetical protein WBF84_06670 [Castellaniella sp.]|uniref:hypothetical protein n=1 Tax=Castellaniella sp. TaxID=1955812 RepID=UPI003C71283A